MSDDDCMDISHTHDDDSTVDSDECYGIYEEDDLEEILYEIPVPKTGNPRNKSLTPISICVIDTIGLVTSRKLLKVLFDPGSTKTMIKSSAVPRKAVPVSMKQGKKINTIAGQMKTSKMVKLRNIELPEFDKNCCIEGTKALIFENECKYDIIFGSDFLTMIGMDIKYSTGEMEWYNNTLPMREPWDMQNKDYVQMCDTYHLQEKDEFFCKE